MIKRALLLVVLVACTNNSGGGGGGDDGVTHVIQLEFPVTPNLYCFDQTLADVDTMTAGEQYECSVSDVTNAGQPNQTETLLPQCNNIATPGSSTNKPCWSVGSDPTSCPAADHLSMHIERTGAPPSNAKVVAQCVAAGA